MKKKRIIRPALLSDMEGLMELQETYLAQTYRGFASEENLANQPKGQWDAMFHTWLEDSQICFDILMVDEKLNGFVVYRRKQEDGQPNGAEGEILSLEVLRGTLIEDANYLVIHSLERMAGLGCANARIWVLRDNLRARFSYEQLGFKLDGNTRTQEIYGQPFRWASYVYRMNNPQ